MKQSAVEWQFEQLFKAEKDWAKEVINGMQFIERKYEILAKAKEMEKEQIKDAYYKGGDDLTKMHFIESEQYYNKTFKQQEQ